MLWYENARSALKLGRIQIIKGWLDSKGETNERIYDVAVSGDRKVGDDGRAREAVGSVVDIAEATCDNSIGTPVLKAYWSDPVFDTTEQAFYYVRVVEIPPPRWTTFDSVKFGIPLPKVVPPTVQVGAYTSPIWYSPG
jgi:hypothetical protein